MKCNKKENHHPPNLAATTIFDIQSKKAILDIKVRENKHISLYHFISLYVTYLIQNLASLFLLGLTLFHILTYGILL